MARSFFVVKLTPYRYLPTGDSVTADLMATTGQFQMVWVLATDVRSSAIARGAVRLLADSPPPVGEREFAHEANLNRVLWTVLPLQRARPPRSIVERLHMHLTTMQTGGE